MTQIAALAYALVIALTVLFQIALIAGAPWGRFTQGGQHEGPLPTPNRIAAGLSILLLISMAAAILSAAGKAPNWPIWTGWLCLAVQLASTIMNCITPSRKERLIWGPVTLLMLLLALIVLFA